MIFKHIFFLLLAFSPISLLIGQDFSKIDQVFSDWQQANHPGGAIAIVDNGKMVYAKGFGLASLEYGAAIDSKTVFNIASVSKQFTAFALILLEQEGKLSLDDDVRKYLPELPDFGHSITLRNLINHTSGLRNMQDILALAGWREGDRISNEDVMRYMTWQKDLNFKTNEGYIYCNTGYNLITAVVERVTGNSFIDWTKQNIFAPLGMNDSEFRNDMTAIKKQTATSYDGDANSGFKKPRPYWDYYGNGNLHTTVEDLAKWMINFSSHSLGGSAGFEKLQEKAKLTENREINYASGISHGKYRGLKTLQHGGSTGGYRSHLRYFPDQKVGVVVLSNFAAAAPSQKLAAVTDIYLAGQFVDQAEKKDIPKFSRDPHKISARLLKEYEGEYYLLDMVVKLFGKDQQMFAEVQGMPPFPLLATSDTSFYISAFNLDVVFEPKVAGQVQKVTVYDPYPNPGQRIDNAAYTPGNINALSGKYYCPELKTSYTIEETKGSLFAYHPRHGALKLIPLDKNHLKGTAWFFSDIRVQRDANNQVQGIYVSSNRMRKVWLEKQ